MSLTALPPGRANGPGHDLTLQHRVTTKIFEDFGGVLNKVFIIGREPVSILHYTRPDLYQSSTTLGLEPVSIIHHTWLGFSIKQPAPN